MANPYQAPSTEEVASSVPRRFRWRLIPVVFLTLFGGPLALVGTILVAARLAGSADLMSEISSVRTLAQLLIIAAGSLWLLSGLTFWNRRWWRAVAWLILGYACGCLGAWLLQRHSVSPPNLALQRTSAAAALGGRSQVSLGGRVR